MTAGRAHRMVSNDISEIGDTVWYVLLGCMGQSSDKELMEVRMAEYDWERMEEQIAYGGIKQVMFQNVGGGINSGFAAKTKCKKYHIS